MIKWALSANILSILFVTLIFPLQQSWHVWLPAQWTFSFSRFKLSCDSKIYTFREHEYAEWNIFFSLSTKYYTHGFCFSLINFNMYRTVYTNISYWSFQAFKKFRTTHLKKIHILLGGKYFSDGTNWLYKYVSIFAKYFNFRAIMSSKSTIYHELKDFFCTFLRDIFGRCTEIFCRLRFARIIIPAVFIACFLGHWVELFARANLPYTKCSLTAWWFNRASNSNLLLCRRILTLSKRMTINQRRELSLFRLQAQ